MALNDASLRQSIINALTPLVMNTDATMTPEAAIELFADGIMTAISLYVRNGVVTTFGSSTTQTGAMT